MSDSESRLELPLIWINGFPGAGKYTIAKLFATFLGKGDPLLIEYHSLIDPVEANISRDHPNYQEERRQAREAVFKKYVEDPAFLNRIIIFTDFQPADDLGHDVAKEYEAAALRAGRYFLPVYLECDVKENIRRLMSLQRRNSGTTKLLSPEILAEIRSRGHIFRFRGNDVGGIPYDVTNEEPEDAAEVLAREVSILISELVKHQK